jgi:hypothetical protein
LKRALDVAQRSFVVLPPEWTVALALNYLSRANCTHVVVAGGPPRSYYLLTRSDALNKLRTLPPTASIGPGLLHKEFGEPTFVDIFTRLKRAATPTVSADLDATKAPEVAIVIDQDGRIVGFVDSGTERASPIGRESTRGDWLRGEEPFAAYPALDVPERVIPRVEFEFFVGFRRDPDPKGSGAVMTIDKPEPGVDCQVVLIPEGIELDRYSAPLPLRIDVAVRFKGTPIAGRDEVAITAIYMYQGQAIGSTRRSIAVGDASAATPGPAAPGGTASPGPVAQQRRNPCRLSDPDPQRFVDLTVTISDQGDGTLFWRFDAPSPPISISDESRLTGAREFAAQLIATLKTESQTGLGAHNILRNLGQQIFQLMPDKFADSLRQVHDCIGRTPTLLLLTNETFVPWELALLEEPLDEGQLHFLGCQTHMGRWLYDDHVVMPPPVNVEMNHLVVVAAGYGGKSGLPELKEALVEQAELVNNWGAIPTAANVKGIDWLIEGEPQAHVVHFAVHGVSDPDLDKQALLLDDKKVRTAPALVGDYRCGQMPRYAFVFLNACQVGTPGTSLGQAAGFPGTIVRGGARGFIAPLWEINDEIARKFAVSFYDQMLKDNKTVSEVLREYRQSYQPGEHTTPLAYVYYGNPSLRLRRAHNSSS